MSHIHGKYRLYPAVNYKLTDSIANNTLVISQKLYFLPYHSYLP